MAKEDKAKVTTAGVTNHLWCQCVLDHLSEALRRGGQLTAALALSLNQFPPGAPVFLEN